MATYNGISYSDLKNVSLKGTIQQNLGILRWDPQSGSGWATNPIGSTDYGLFVNSSGNLVFSSLGTQTVLASGGGSGGIPSWNAIFAGNKTMSVQGTAFTITDTTSSNSNNVLDLVASGTSGALLSFAQSGSGLDVSGTSATWTVSAAGAAAFLSVASATINGAGSGITIGDSGANVVTIGTNSNTITMAKATTFSSSLTGVNGIFTSTSNTVVPLLVTDNTLSTFGHGVANGGVVVVRSTSLTTGTAIKAQTAEGTLTTGFYFEAWDTTSSYTAFSVGKYGATTIAGSAFGTAALTVTLGDIVVSSGKLLVTSAGTGASANVFTNNSIVAHTLFALAGSGAFTGSTTTSFVTITPSGLTSGTAIYVPLAAMTTGTGLSMVANALTTGLLVSLTHTTAVIADGGSMLNISSTSADTGGSTTGTLINLISSGAQAATLVELTDTATTTGTLMLLSQATTQTTGHVLSLLSTGTITTTGDVLAVTANSATTSTGVVRVTANGLTTGVALLVTSSGVIATTGDLVSLVASGLTTGTALNLGTLAALTTGKGISIAHTTSVIASGGSLLNLSSTSVDTATTSGVLVNLSSTASLAGTQVLQTYSGLTTGIGESIVTSALTTGTILKVTATAATLTTGRYFSANDGTSEVFGIGTNGHIISIGTAAAPTIAVSTQAGITAAAITAGGTDTCGIITTTGTSTGATILTVTFGKTYTTAPKAVILTPANAAAGMPNTGYIVGTITATTFTITVAASGTYAATPSWMYAVIA